MATLANGLFLLTERRLFSTWKDLRLSASAITVNEEQQEAILKVFAGEIQLMQLAAYCAPSEAKGVY